MKTQIPIPQFDLHPSRRHHPFIPVADHSPSSPFGLPLLSSLPRRHSYLALVGAALFVDLAAVLSIFHFHFNSVAASSSAIAVVNKMHDVFVSFRGSDVRDGFLSHLLKALLQEKIDVFVDEELERGKEISDSLLEKIEQSYVSIVIFSPNYADSEWCLQELLEIAECRKTAGQIVIPVFYGVDPSYVLDLTGSYGDAMAQHRTKFDESLVESWGNALKATASLSGLVYSDFKPESNLIEEIVKQAIEKLNFLFSSPSDSIFNDGLVGIDSRVEEVMSLLCGSEELCIVGIWGEGGIGKTTLAQATFDRIYNQFDSQCFVRDVREKSEKFTADAVLNEVVSKLFGTSNSDMTRKRLSRKKVILVLDDVSNLDQIKSIMRYKVDVGSGSRIIVTSRDSHLLNNLGVKIYAVKKLKDHEALQLFCLKAFKEKVPQGGYSELTAKAVKYAQGLPLALEVLGSNLFLRSMEEWEDELEKLKVASDKKIHKILRISYDGLSDVEKEIFQDIACCFKGRHRHDVERIIDVRGSKIAISCLVEKALISISSGNWINMHDLLQQMAKDIICEEKAPEKRTWLMDPEEIYFLLTREMGTEAVRGMSLDLSKIRSINLSPAAFMNLYNLKYLNFYTSSTDTRVCVPQGLQYLPEKLRYLCWSRYPSKSLPLTSFWMEKLVALDMSHSQLEKLWDGVQDLPNLQKIDLSCSEKLSEVPDLSKAPNLQSLNLNKCISLVQIPYSTTCLRNLIELRLQYCSNLKSLPDDICNIKSLSLLDVSWCEKLRELPQNFGNLESLSRFDACDSGIQVFPGDFPFLTKIDLSDCGFPEFPYSLCSVISLTHLRIGGNDFESIPESIQQLSNLQILILDSCENLKVLPEGIGRLLNLETLVLYYCWKLQYLPEDINLLPHLRHLDLRECASLDEVQCSEIMACRIEAFVEEWREAISWTWFAKCTILWYPGSEIPEIMIHKNHQGSCLFFTFELLQYQDEDRLSFYTCVILGSRTDDYDDITCKGNFTDKSGLGFCVEGKQNSFDVQYFPFQGEHLLIKPYHFVSKNFVMGAEYEVEFEFDGSIRGSELNQEDEHFSPRNGILSCGLLPLFPHRTADKYYFTDHF